MTDQRGPRTRQETRAAGEEALKTFLSQNPTIVERCQNAVGNWRLDVEQGNPGASAIPTPVFVCGLGGADAPPRGR
jgi:hypothetical protein